MYRDSSVGTVTCYGLDGPGFDTPWVGGFSYRSRPAPRSPQPPVRLIMGLFFLETKQPGRGANHQLPSSSEVKERVVTPLLPLWAFMATNSTCTLTCVINSTNYEAKTCILTCVTHLQQFLHKCHQGKCSLDNVILQPEYANYCALTCTGFDAYS